MQGEEEEDLALFGDRREWVGRFWMRTSASLPFSPRPAGRTRGAHRPGRRSGPSDLGRLRSGSRGRVPPRPSRPEPRGEGGLQLAARAAPRIVWARPADLVCDRPSVSLAVFLEDAPIGVPSPLATTAGSRGFPTGRGRRSRAGGGSASSSSSPRPVRLRFNPAHTPRPGRPRLWQTGRSLDSLNRGLIALNERLVV